jgi:hypothetical protein
MSLAAVPDKEGDIAPSLKYLIEQIRNGEINGDVIFDELRQVQQVDVERLSIWTDSIVNNKTLLAKVNCSENYGAGISREASNSSVAQEEPATESTKRIFL